MLLSSSCIGLIFQFQHSFNGNTQKKSKNIVDREDPPPLHPFLYEPMVKAKKNQPFRQGSEAAYAPGGLHKFFNKKKTKTLAKKKKKIGRPAKNKAKTVGCPISSNKSPPTPRPHLRKSPPEIAAAGKAAKGGNDSVDVAEAVKDDDNAPKKKRGRTNWGKEPHRGDSKRQSTSI